MGYEFLLYQLVNGILYPVAKHWADDDKKNILKQMLAFILLRSSFEYSMATGYGMVLDAISTFKTPFPIMSLWDSFTNFFKSLYNIGTSVITGKESKKISRGAYKGMTELERWLIKITPIKNLWELQDIPSKLRYYET